MMRRKLLAGLILIASPLVISAQVIPIHIDQADFLISNAGSDTVICKNHSLNLGSDEVAQGGVPGYFYNWFPSVYLDDPTKANPDCSPEETITYILTVTDAKGCTSSDYITVGIDPCLGINMIEEASIMIYPNPVKDNFRISGLPFSTDRLNVSLINKLGQTVLYNDYTALSSLGEVEVSLSGLILPPGVYFVKLGYKGTYLVKTVQIY
ncbi:MAG: T9SS type A sorting domain-containing protein [Bacteroidetes bacterium]|jgi:hypothetical protein|nr:T9SS type A sorting domain-containing protein [Bacteroidota bacterium]MBT3749964.1 T9SS type A sorting domain-containing protein [Bacteroidota bacterium]MBT4399484.1 T9SS type A sorting domain-containing protein [Bacteroidota bacterium]MBT4408555.1 T9SS type A sorting domain-containing protein [Bacteroidota bacterium]MBT5425704.1 T9SS type A sorting domain-containing protein [Bacteroidota bacterium]